MNSKLCADDIKDDVLLDVAQSFVLAEQRVQQVILISGIVDHEYSFKNLLTFEFVTWHIHKRIDIPLLGFLYKRVRQINPNIVCDILFLPLT
tara:strand:+ start:266 stop:541 length:276 start_codon:yes stop_codon:yes gene_type:complete